MIDLVFALTISSILFFSIASIYESYYINKKNYEVEIEANDILRGIALEIKKNISFEFFNSLEKEKIYFLNIRNIQELIANDFINLLNLKKNNTGDLWSIKVLEVEQDKILNIQINYKYSSNKRNFELKEIVTKLVYIE